MSFYAGYNLHWASVLLFTILSATAFEFWLVRQARTRAQSLSPSLLFIMALVPALYAGLVQTNLIADHYVRFARPFAAWLPALAAAFILSRFASPTKLRAVSEQLTRALLVLTATALGLVAAGVEIGQKLDRMAVVIAIDRSRSIDLVRDAESRLNQELQLAQLGMTEEDRLGVLAFGSTAQVESPLRVRTKERSPQQVAIGRDATDLEQAIRRALAELPSDASGKIVLMSDGVATRGDTFGAVAAAVAAGVPIDVVPLDQRRLENLRLVNISAPPTVSEGETFDLRVVLESATSTELELRLLQDGDVVRRGSLKVKAGQDVVSLRHRANRAGLRRLEVQISATDPALDQLAEDNQRTTFVRVRGKTNALVISSSAVQAVPIVTALTSAGIQVDNVQAFDAPTEVAQLTRYDLVVLRDVAARFWTPAQLSAFASYVRSMGGGLLLTGSDQSMGPGGYGKTPVEEVSPVSFDLKQDRRRARLGQVVAIDYSGSMAATAGNATKLQLANEAAVRSSQLLSSGDRLGVIHVDTQVSWTLPLSRVADHDAIARAIRAVGPGGGGIFVDLTLRSAYQKLRLEKTNLKHVLLFADGSDAEQMNEAANLVKTALKGGITTSVVALGRGSDVPALEALSRLGNGRFYLIEDAERLPAVFAQETIMATRSSLNEVRFVPRPRSAGGVLRGVDLSQAPALEGYVVTIPKPRTEVLLEGPDQDPILARWSVGLGKTGAFMSAYASPWGVAWTGWPEAAQLFAQLGRSLARGNDDTNTRLRVEATNGRLEISAELLGGSVADSYQRLSASVAGPFGLERMLPLTATGPGHYQASIPLERPGAYMVSAIDVTTGSLLATAGTEQSAADELKPTGSDRGTLAKIAREARGSLRDTLAGVFRERLTPRFAYRDIDGWLTIVAAMLLLCSVATRRLAWSLPTSRFARLFWRRSAASNHTTESAKATRRAAAPPHLGETNTETPNAEMPASFKPPSPSAPTAPEMLLAGKRKRDEAAIAGANAGGRPPAVTASERLPAQPSPADPLSSSSGETGTRIGSTPTSTHPEEKLSAAEVLLLRRRKEKK